VLELVRNAAILGIKEYGNRSEGRHRRVGQEGPRLLTDADRNQRNRPKVIQNPPNLVQRAPTGAAPLYDPDKWNEIKRLTDERGSKQRGIPRAADPAKYPLSCRIVDLTDECGATLYGHTVGQRRVYTCGRYMRTAGSECENNSIDAEAMLKLTLLTLQQQIHQYGQQAQLRALLEERAHRALADSVPSPAEQQRAALETKLEELRHQHEVIGSRMVRETDDDCYNRAKLEYKKSAAAIAECESALAKCHTTAPAKSGDDGIETAMQLCTILAGAANDPTAPNRL
jgi:hypothetical protein